VRHKKTREQQVDQVSCLAEIRCQYIAGAVMGLLYEIFYKVHTARNCHLRFLAPQQSGVGA
jgi:hypothetical protein